MAIDHVLAGVPVADMDRALAWYEQLFGRPFDDRPMTEAAEWRLATGGGIQVVLDPKRSGKSLVTLAVDNVRDFVEDAVAHGVAATASCPEGTAFWLTRITDPFGNILTFAEDRRDAPAAAASSLEHLHFPNENATYRLARNKLLDDERALRRQIERIAAERRALPPGGRVKEDYVFTGESGPVRLSALFKVGKDSLALYSFMFGPERDVPCPGCTHFLDALDGQSEHINQNVNFYAVAKSPWPRLRQLAEDRGWQHLRLLSTDGNSYDRDYFGDSLALTPRMRHQQEFKDGEEWDMPMLNLFHREAGFIHHFWGSELLYVPAEPGQQYRHNDLLDPLWNMLDLTPEGRGNFEPRLSY